MHVHRDGVKLFQRSQSVEQKDYDTSSFDCLNSSAENIRRDALKVLDDAHAKSLTQDLVSVLVVAVPDVLGGHE
jgi:hypothetical protein